MEQPTLPLTVVEPDAGTIVTMGGLTTTVKVPSTATAGVVAIVEHTLAPGFLGAPPHLHQREDEISYVLDGDLTVQVGEQVQVVSAGAYIVKPRGIMHTVWNAGQTMVRYIEIIAPGGLESYFAARAALIRADGPPDMAAITALQEQYALSFERERVPQLLQRYGLRM
ncbi:MAG TPA: cupin domain-containing protein [Roseiflexaceae bacterium]|nr:cupin domain-containing protein [Roseiflexaceae bacterium]